MKFEEFKEKYFGKSYEEIKEGLSKEKDFWRKSEKLKLTIDADILAEEIVRLDKNNAGFTIFKKKYLIMKYIYQNLTKLELVPEDENFEDYDSFVEKIILELNEQANFFKNMVEEIIKEKECQVIQELYNIFNEGIPTVEEMKELQNTIGGMFKDESPEKLKTIEKILSFNDPTMNEIKDIVLDSQIKQEVVEQIQQLENKKR